MNAKTMTVAGVMSGTSADGIDVAWCGSLPESCGRSLCLWRTKALVFVCRCGAHVLQR